MSTTIVLAILLGALVVTVGIIAALLLAAGRWDRAETFSRQDLNREPVRPFGPFDSKGF